MRVLHYRHVIPQLSGIKRSLLDGIPRLFVINYFFTVNFKSVIIRMTTFDPCKKLACKLQTCLKENVYQPSRCEGVIEELRQCCIKHSSNSVVCEGIDTSKPYEHKTVDYKKVVR